MKNIIKFFEFTVVAAPFVILLSTILLNPFVNTSPESLPLIFGQIANADNEITQTSSEVNNCDPPNMCSSFLGQNAIVGSGDGNDISQGLIHLNQCKFSNPDPSSSTLCDTITEQNAIVESGNGNDMSQDLTSVNQCVEVDFCGGGGIQTQAVGRIQLGEVFDEGTDNENLQTTITDPKSYNDNTAIQVVQEANQNCTYRC